MISANNPGAIALGVSCAFAAWMILEMVFLLVHRWSAERREASDKRIDIMLTRDVLEALDESDAHDVLRHFDAASKAEQLRAMRHLIQLVRGDDRDRLFEICERAHLFDETLRKLGSPIKARRIESVRELELYGTASCVEGLERCLAQDKSPTVRLQAAVALANLGHLPECRHLLTRLDLTHRPLTRMHASLFRSIAGRDFPTMVDLSFDDAFVDQRPMLVDALGWTANYDALAGLDQHGHDTNPEVRCAAIRAARRIGHPAAAVWITALLVDPSEPVRIQAVQACGDLGLRETVPILLSLAQHQSWWVRTRATEALQKLRSASPGGISVLATAA